MEEFFSGPVLVPYKVITLNPVAEAVGRRGWFFTVFPAWWILGGFGGCRTSSASDFRDQQNARTPKQNQPQGRQDFYLRPPNTRSTSQSLSRLKKFPGLNDVQGFQPCRLKTQRLQTSTFFGGGLATGSSSPEPFQKPSLEILEMK